MKRSRAWPLMFSSFLTSCLLFAATAVAASASATSLAPAATSMSADVGMKFINQRILPIQDPVLSVIFEDKIPQKINVSCRSCTTSGSISVVAGGYDPSDSDQDIAQDFYNKGYIQATAHGVNGNFQTEVNLLPGFTLASVKIPIFTLPLGKVKLGKAGSIDLKFNIFVPLSIQLNSEVEILPSIKIEIPDGATLFLNFGSLSRSYVTGFNGTRVTPGFDINQPNLSFSFLQGVKMVLDLGASNNANTSSVTLSGKLAAALELPKFNTTVRALSNVNSSCLTPQAGEQKYDNAVGVSYAAGLDLSLTGKITAKTKVASFDWNAPDLGRYNTSVTLANQCFAWDASKKGLKQTSAASSLVGSSPSGTLYKMALLAFVAAAVTL